MTSALQVESLYRNFGALQVVRNLSFSIPADEKRIVIIGPNGAGKTTLFNLIAAVDRDLVPPSLCNIIFQVVSRQV